MSKYQTIEICSPDGKAMYITIDGWMFYIDNTTNEQIMECWKNDGTDGMYNKRWKTNTFLINGETTKVLNHE